MKQLNKTKMLFTVLSGIVLVLEITIGYLFPNWTFINGNLTIAYSIIGYLAFSSFILCIPILFNASKMLTIPLGVVLFIIFFINSCSVIHPIDTTTKPKDIAIVKTYENGNQLIVRKRINAKTNNIILDTVLVKDYFIFRKLLNKEDETTDR